MRATGHHPPHPRRRKWGQHFLVRPATTRRILDLLEISSRDRFLEIGPGLGALTLGIADRGAALLAVEIDRTLAERLRPALATRDRVHLEVGDILKLDPRELLRALEARFGRGSIRVVGNLPYEIATAVLQKFLAPAMPVRDYHFMFQEEVAERLVAKPSSRPYGYLSVLCQVHCRPRIRLRIGPGAFRPPPRVQSAFVALFPHPPPWRSAAMESRFRKWVQIAFANRRKTLANNLRLGTGWANREIERFLGDAGMPPGVRAEELSPAAFLQLFARLRRTDVLT